MYTYNKDDKTYTFSSDELNIDELIDTSLQPNDSDENINNDEKEPKKKIEVINGGNELDISPVSNYIEVEKPKSEKKDNIIIPEEKK